MTAGLGSLILPGGDEVENILRSVREDVCMYETHEAQCANRQTYYSHQVRGPEKRVANLIAR